MEGLRLPLKPLYLYGVLKCKAIDSRIERHQSHHYQVHVTDSRIQYRIAINVLSQSYPSALLYFANEAFKHPMTSTLEKLPLGFIQLNSESTELSLDYIRGDLFDHRAMQPLPHHVDGPDNDLNEKIDMYIKRAIRTDDAVIYAFGDKWGPENFEDSIFGFMPGNGMHNIHMNQGNTGHRSDDNRVWQDGGLLLHFPSEKKWVAIFLAFQSQSFVTNNKTGRIVDR